MTRKNLLIIGGILAALLIAGALFAFVFDDDETATESPQEQTVVEEMPFEEGEESTTQESPQEESPATEAEKPNTPVTRVSEKPEVSTAFGHSASNPVKNGQTTSTTCTSEPNVSCTVTFSNGNQEIVFDAQTTNADGVALWSRTGGEDVPSGTWNVSAKVGDKTSNSEEIFVQ